MTFDQTFDLCPLSVQGCDEVEIINVMLLTIISLSIVTSVIAFGCTYISCYALKYPEKPVSIRHSCLEFLLRSIM